jgi:hypothetical protein
MIHHRSLSHLLDVFIKNFFYGGLALGVGLTFVEYFRNNQDLIYLYAYITSSFFLVQLYKYYYVNASIPELAHGFILHSIIGGIIYVFFILFMLYLFNLYKQSRKRAHDGIDAFSSSKLVFWNIFFYLLTIPLYYVLLKYKYI